MSETTVLNHHGPTCENNSNSNERTQHKTKEGQSDELLKNKQKICEEESEREEKPPSSMAEERQESHEGQENQNANQESVQHSEEEKQQEERERIEVLKAVEEAQDQIKTKMLLRSKNLAAIAAYSSDTALKGLDSSVKKNSAFIKKLRSITEQQRESLTNEFNGLNLSRYIQEAVSSVIEGLTKLKQSDVSCVAHICSLIHQRYSEFSDLLRKELVKVFDKYAGKDEERTANVSRFRVSLRLFGELIIIGVFCHLEESIKVIKAILSNIINCDKDSHVYVQIIISFARHCGEDFAGVLPRRHRQFVEKHNITWPSSGEIPMETQATFHALLQSYYASLAKHLLRAHKDLQNRERQNRHILLTKGELHPDKKEALEKVQKAYDKMLTSTSTLSDVLDEDMPELPPDEFAQENEGGSTIDIFNPFNMEYDGESGMWEDEDSRVFYENLKDLKASLPGILYKDESKTSSSDNLSEEKVKSDTEKAEVVETDDVPEEAEELEVEEDFEDKETEDSADESGSEKGSVVTASSLESLIAKLPTCVNKDMIDEKNRMKLCRALFNVQRTRLDLLPIYSRLVATLDQCVNDISPELVRLLKGEFRHHVKKKDQINLESKIKTSRLIGEMTKFQMFPKGETLYCLKMLLEDFTHHNIEMACNLLEVSGRFLYRSPDSHIRTKNLLELMMRKKTVQNLDSRHLSLIDNAFYYCNPPERQKYVAKERPPIHEYIRKLLYKDLSKTTTEKVLRQMRKLPWDTTEIALYAIKCLIRVWNVKYNSIHCAANLLAGLSVYHEEVGLCVVDGVLEEIRIGMEVNYPKLNQRRLCCVKYLGEMYNYRLVDIRVIFNTMYSFITFGNNDDGIPSELDSATHLFRVRLICTILDTCGQFFDHGSSKRKLDYFLDYFQLYVLRKKANPEWNEHHPFPRDVDYMVADTMELLRPKLRLFTTVEEALGKVEQIQKDHQEQIGRNILPSDYQDQDNDNPENRPSNPIAVPGVPKTSNSLGSSPCQSPMLRDEYEPSESGESEQDVEDENAEEGEEIDDYEIIDMDEEMEEDDTMTKVKVLSPPKLEPTTEDVEFKSQFERLMIDDLHTRRSEMIKVPNLDIAVPMHLKGQGRKNAPSPKKEDSVNFVLMLRKGNKQQYKDFEVPISSNLAAT
ncbi:hypothetical protein QZH41_009266, partial [Actinostola sp. cb2023]